MIKDEEALQKLVPSIISLSKDEALQAQLKDNIGRLAVTNADELIAKEILDSLK
jgi:UDP-N-acetylglucosamine--N-acetylmuramyl-(pentapeptide) pyrophosphoryl-undecaprenol N-acetylglucosamine transferase